MKNNLIRPDPRVFFAGQNMDGILNFYGVVKDNEGAPVKGAIVIAFSCLANGIERLLGSAFTDREGAYIISIPKLTDYNSLLGFKVRAGKTCLLPESARNLWEHCHPNEELAPELNEILIDNIPLTGHHSDEPIDEVEVDTNMNKEPEIEKSLEDKFIDKWKDNFVTVSINQVELNTLPVIVAPTVQTGAATNISTDSVTLHGSINHTGGEDCDQRKFQIGLQGGGDWMDTGIENGSFGPESFSFTISGLIPDATYEFKAMAHNFAGWGEGEVSIFTTGISSKVLTESTPALVNSDNMGKGSLSPRNPYNAYYSTYYKIKEMNSAEKTTKSITNITVIPAASKNMKSNSSKIDSKQNVLPKNNPYYVITLPIEASKNDKKAEEK